MKTNLLFSLGVLVAFCGCGPGLRNFGPVPSENGGVFASNVPHIYATAGVMDGNIGGLANADAICDRDSNKPAGTGTYRALLANGTTRVACTTVNCRGGAREHVGWVLRANTTYVNAAGAVVGTTNSYGIFTFPLRAPVENTKNTAWTGLNANWTTSNNCSGWTSNSGSGRWGKPSASDVSALNDDSGNCSEPNVLYCVEQ